MRLVRFQVQGRPAYGILNNDEVGELDGEGYGSLTSLRVTHRTADVNFLAPCVPTKIVAVGLNYRDHARELGMAAGGTHPLPEAADKPDRSRGRDHLASHEPPDRL